MKIALTYNIRHVKPSLVSQQAQAEAEYDTWETINGIKKALEKIGHQVVLVECNPHAYENLRKLKNKIGLVFSYCEGIAGADREAQIPAMLESLQIPYTGSGPLTSAILLNKARTKELLSFYGLPTPAWNIIYPNELKDYSLSELVSKVLKNHTSFPLIVKPNSEGSSKGIFNESVVKTKETLVKMVKRILTEYNQGTLIENYLQGREFTVAMLQEKGRWRVLPIIEVSFDEVPKEMYPIDSYEVKWIYDSPEKEIDPLSCPAGVSHELRKAIEEICIKTCEVLEIRDWCRIDLRLDARGVPNILDINNPPGLIPDPAENSRYPRAAREAGINFEGILDKIIQSALYRYQ